MSVPRKVPLPCALPREVADRIVRSVLDDLGLRGIEADKEIVRRCMAPPHHAKATEIAAVTHMSAATVYRRRLDVIEEDRNGRDTPAA